MNGVSRILLDTIMYRNATIRISMEMTVKSTKRPKGCYFDIYGWDEEKLKTLTCENCPLPAMICGYKGLAVIEKVGKEISKSKIVITSNP